MKQKFWKNFWYLFRGYWNSEEKWKARGLLAFVIGLNFASVYLLVRLNSWYNVFYNALQQYQAESFWPLIGEFTGLAFLYIILVVYAIYLRQMLQIKWRTWMTNRYLDDWMKGQVYYRLQVLRSDTDNPDQRISEDINQFVSLTLQLLIGMLKKITPRFRRRALESLRRLHRAFWRPRVRHLRLYVLVLAALLGARHDRRPLRRPQAHRAQL